jgi:PAS domain S-box-containing protein
MARRTNSLFSKFLKGIQSIHQNLKARRKPIHWLRNEDFYHQVFSNANDAIFLLEDGTFMECNPKTLEVFACRKDQIIGQSPAFFSPETQPDGENSEDKAKRYIDAAFAGRYQNFEWVHKRLDGTCFDAEVSLIRLEHKGKAFLQANLRDVTQKNIDKQQLIEKKEQLEILANSNIYATFVSTIDGSGKILFANEATLRFLNIRQDQLHNVHTYDFFVDPNVRTAYLQELNEKGSISEREIQIWSKGEIINIITSSNIFTYKGELCAMNVFIDVTDRRKAEEALLKSEEQYRYIIEKLPIGIYSRTTSGKFTYANPTFLHDIQCSSLEELNELYESIDARWINPERAIEFINEIKREKNISNFELGFQLINDEICWFSINAVYNDESDELTGYALNITDKKLAISDANDSSQRYKRLYESLMDAHCVVDMNGRLLEFNSVFEQMIGYTKNELLQKTFHDITPPRWHDYESGIVNYQLQTQGYTNVYEKEYIHKDGHVFPVELRTYLLTDANGNHTGMWAMIRDITDRKKAEEALKASEKRFFDAIAFQPIPIGIVDNNSISYLNHKFTEIFGYTTANVPTVDEWMLHAYPDKSYRVAVQSQWLYDLDFSMNKGASTPLRVNHITCKNGDVKWVEITSRLIGNTVISVFNDITERRNVEMSLRESEERFRLVATLSGHMVYEYQADGDLLKWGGAIEQVTGFSDNEYACLDIKEWAENIHPDDRKAVTSQFQDAIAHNKTFHVEYRYRHKSGEYIWIEEECFALTVVNDHVQKAVGVMKDVTMSKSMERQILNRVIETEERERMNFSQELHDGLGPLLSAIKMYVQWLEKPNANLKPAEILKDIESLLDESSRTVRDISFKLSPHVLQNYGLVEAIKAYADKIKETKSIDFSLDTQQFTTRFNEMEEAVIYRVLCECITNTIKYANASRIEVSLCCRDNNFEMTYSDNGGGFDVDEALASRKGIGLLNIQSRLKSINGQMTITSQIGCGTTINFKVDDLCNKNN